MWGNSTETMEWRNNLYAMMEQKSRSGENGAGTGEWSNNLDIVP